ncbi:MAG TPA: TrkH family potassium uptake protein [Gemmatimonadota bacterium]|nr:TrkH family potassium uptake protein [Gemmatimonadota bacterium]
MRKQAVLHVVGALTALAGVTMLLPAGVAALFYREGAATQIGIAAGITIGAGLLLYRFTGRTEEISLRDGFAIVTLGWISIAIFGSLPYLLSGSIPSVSGAFFESMSGLTTTGASVVADVDTLPRGILLWRSQTQWMGGMGFIVLSVAVLPLLGVGGMQLLQAEIPGLSADRLRPRVRHTATLLWTVYAIFTAVQGVLLWFGGMTPFEALNQSFSGMAGGGFSTENASIAAFGPFVQYVIVAFMFLTGINFTLHYSWLTGRWTAVRRSLELRVYAIITAIATLALTVLVWAPGTIDGFEASFRAGLFQATSILTTTGYATADYETWVPAAQVLILLLMLIGGCSGSTSGSIKVLRHIIVAKEARITMRMLLHPRAVFVYKVDGKPVSPDVLASVSGFLILYLLSLVTGLLGLTLLGLDPLTAIGATVSALGNVGPGFGAVGPVETYATLPVPALWVLSILMLLGRLELYTVLILFTRGYWRR